MNKDILAAIYEAWRDENETDLPEFAAVLQAAAADPEQKTDKLTFAAADLQRAAFAAGCEYAARSK